MKRPKTAPEAEFGHATVDEQVNENNGESGGTSHVFFLPFAFCKHDHPRYHPRRLDQTMEHRFGIGSEPTSSAEDIQQRSTGGEHYKAPVGCNDDCAVVTAHPFGAIGQEVKAKAASHTSSASTCSSDDRDGGISLHMESRERAGSLRELVQQSTPIEPIAFAVPNAGFNDTPSRHQQMSPTKPQQGAFEATLRSPPWIMHPAPESGECSSMPLPPRSAGPHNVGPYAMIPSPTMRVHPEFHLQHFQYIGNDNADVRTKQDPAQKPVQFPPQVPSMATNPSPERHIMGYRELINGITKDLEAICREFVLIDIRTNTTESDNDLAFLDLVVAHMGSHDAAAYILKRIDLHVALVIGLIWRQVSTYILSRPVFDKAPSRSAAAFYHAYLDETFAHAYHTDDLIVRQTCVERRSSFVADIQRAPEYQAFVKTFATQVANNIVRDLMPVWRVGSTYKISQVLIEKVTTRLVRLVSRMRAEAKVFHFDFYRFGTQFNSATMSKRNPDLLLDHSNDDTYAVMCGIAPAVIEMELSAGHVDARPVYLAEVLVHDKSKQIDEALDQVKLYGPMPMPPFRGRRRSRRKTGTAPSLNRGDSTNMQDPK